MTSETVLAMHLSQASTETGKLPQVKPRVLRGTYLASVTRLALVSTLLAELLTVHRMETQLALLATSEGQPDN